MVQEASLFLSQHQDSSGPVGETLEHAFQDLTRLRPSPASTDSSRTPLDPASQSAEAERHGDRAEGDDGEECLSELGPLPARLQDD